MLVVPVGGFRGSSQQVGGGSLNCLDFGDSKFSSIEGCAGNKCPWQHGKETPEMADPGKLAGLLGSQSLNSVAAFSSVSPEIKQAIESVKYIAENMRSRNKAKEVSCCPPGDRLAREVRVQQN